jgi:hypothetical protein
MKKYLSKALLILQKSWKNYLALNEYYIRQHCQYTPRNNNQSEFISKK